LDKFQYTQPKKIPDTYHFTKPSFEVLGCYKAPSLLGIRMRNKRGKDHRISREYTFKFINQPKKKQFKNFSVIGYSDTSSIFKRLINTLPKFVL
jgi:hypothetical protein